MTKPSNFKFKIRNLSLQDVKEVYNLLTANRPYVGLNSRYTYFLLAKDFSDTCVVAEHQGKIVGFSSGYISPNKTDTFFNWEAVVHKDYRGNNLQKHMLITQINMTGAQYFEGTINPSNEPSKKNFSELAQSLETNCKENMLFSEEDFENDGHEPEILYRVGPISQMQLEKNMQLFEGTEEILEEKMFRHVKGYANDLVTSWDVNLKPYSSQALKKNHQSDKL